jgi:2-polyprenyl-3-methyl-5-hydroxy-6-metoxy-1,4-benzoquinol methylase
MPLVLRAERDCAYDSPDHLVPWGTRWDRSINGRFNEKLWLLYPKTHVVKVLDLGCSGGDFVKSCIDDGHFAVGIEGSTFSKDHKRSAWAIIPDYLFTCDITRPFELVFQSGSQEQKLNFDVVTSWEVLEHIKEADLPALASNVHAHLSPGGLWIMSVANSEDVRGGLRLHQTVRPREWWRGKFKSLGFELLEQHKSYFARQFVRGARVDNEESFHFVLTNDVQRAPGIPKVPLAEKAYDVWAGSKPQRLFRMLTIGAPRSSMWS